jgi:hypothetical protein
MPSSGELGDMSGTKVGLYFGFGNGMSSSSIPRRVGLIPTAAIPLGNVRSLCALSSKRSIIRKYWGEAARHGTASHFVVLPKRCPQGAHVASHPIVLGPKYFACSQRMSASLSMPLVVIAGRPVR